jgi:crotonobetainyl-CoA:carnitine CoA-transferase CaiB-like acyl-CoA transferase
MAPVRQSGAKMPVTRPGHAPSRRAGASLLTRNGGMMNKPLEGVRVVEVSMWAFVPSAGAVLADWGAEVIKVEAPSGDPIRALTFGGVTKAGDVAPSWEMFNRNKRGIALDLDHPTGQAIVHELAASAGVFLTSLLPAARGKLRIDEETIRAVNPQIIYASGTGQGARGPEAGKGGYDSISFWSRGSVSASVTPDGAEPIGMPSGAFGDSLSGMALAGGIAGALVRKAKTGEGALVDGSLLGTAMWSMQMATIGAAVAGIDEMPKMTRQNSPNPLVNTYRTSDGRWIALCMLQPDLYWAPFCTAIGRDDLATDERFATGEARDAHIPAAIAELDAVFATKPLAEWKPILAGQRGQWDVVKKVSELLEDQQAEANGFFQRVDYRDGQQLPLISNPIQFDRAPPELAPAPDFGGDTDEILLGLGWDWDRILEAKAAGAAF